MEIIAYMIRWHTVGRLVNIREGWIDFLVEYFCSCAALFLLLIDYLSLPFTLRSTHVLCSKRNPVLMVYGYMARGFHMALLRYRLKKDGWKDVFFFFYWPPKGGILYVADRLKNMIEKLLEIDSGKKVDLICHSLGGIVALYYVTKLGGADKIQHLISLGTPFKGSKLWRFSPRQWCREILKPNNTLLEGLMEEVPSQPKITSIYSSFDELILPYHSSKLEIDGIKNVEIDGIGHQRLVFSKKVYSLIRDSLTE